MPSDNQHLTNEMNSFTTFVTIYYSITIYGIEYLFKIFRQYLILKAYTAPATFLYFLYDIYMLDSSQ